MQREKQNSEIVSIDEGMQIDWSERQSLNAWSPRTETLQPDSKVKAEICSRFLKQHREIISIDEEMQIDSVENLAHRSSAGMLPLRIDSRTKRPQMQTENLENSGLVRPK
jgi:hypothetical protein